MTLCINCNKTLAKGTRGNQCRGCYEKKRSDTDGNAIGNKATSNSEALFPDVTAEQLNSLPELPNNWIGESFQNLTGGHLLKIMMHANSVLIEQINVMKGTIATLRAATTSNLSQCNKANDLIKANDEKITTQDGEIKT